MSKVMPNERISQILPTVKCSDCGRDVQIRKLGEHVCSSAPAVPALPILPDLQEKRPFPPRATPSPITPTYNTGGPRYDAKPSRPYETSPVSPTFHAGHDFRRPSVKDNDRWHDSPRQVSPLNTRPPYREEREERMEREIGYRKDGSTAYRGRDPDGNYGGRSNGSSGAGNGNAYYGYNDSPKTPPFLPSPSSDRPRKNSTSPAPPDSRSGDPNPSHWAGSPWQQRDPPQPKSPPRDASLGAFDSRAHDMKRPAGGGGGNGGTGPLDTLMADLMNSFGSDIDDPHRRPEPTNNFDGCNACGEEFDYRDQIVYDNRHYSYHKSCYTCQMCHLDFDQRHAPMKHNGKLYCERDYLVVKKRIMCTGCERPIASNIDPLKVAGRYYHPGHIKCYHCYTPLDERTGYKEYQGRIYCRSDYKKMLLPICRACDRPVEREAVSALDGKLQGKWHLECFGCHTCHRPFPDNSFYVFENAPYCKRHYHQLNNSLCRTCDDPIEGPCAQTIEGWRFHPACFRCNVCRCAITDIYYMFERRIYCETHIRQLQRQRNIRAEKRKTQFGQI